jgi:uncharacterized protein
MRDFRDAKAMAHTLREALKLKSISVTHSESLELVAELLGFQDWNVLSARIQSEGRRTAAEASAPAASPADARLPTVPLRDIVLFPQMIAPIFIGRDASKRAIDHAMTSGNRILGVTQRRSIDDNPAPGDLYEIGVTASVIDLTALDDGTVRVIVKGLERAAIVRLTEGQFLAAEITAIEELRGPDAEAFALMRAVSDRFQTYRGARLGSRPFARFLHVPHTDDPGALADAVAALLLSVPIEWRQDLLETHDVIKRLEKVLALMETSQEAA